MAYKLQINDKQNGFNFHVKYENLARYSKIKPDVIARTPNGKVAKERTVFQGQILQAGSTQRKWTDDEGNIYEKSELCFYLDGEEIEENSQTKVFDITQYENDDNYVNSYVVDKYYELFPSDNGMKKDFDRNKAKACNLHGMRKLWEHLFKNNLLARGEFCASSKGFVVSDAYIRAIQIGSAWGLELGVFKEKKNYQYLQEDLPPIPQEKTAKTRLKMV